MAFSMFFTLLEFSNVSITVILNVLADSLEIAIFPQPFVLISVWVDCCTRALNLVLLKLSLVQCAIRKEHFSKTIFHSPYIVALVRNAVDGNFFSLAMLQAAGPFPIIVVTIEL